MPAVFDADTKALGEITRGPRTLAERVHNGSITPPELSGGTFARLQPGHVRHSSIHGHRQPTGAILAVGALARRTVVRKKKLVARQTMSIAPLRMRSPHPLWGRCGAVPGAYSRAVGRATGVDLVAFSARGKSVPRSRRVRSCQYRSCHPSDDAESEAEQPGKGGGRMAGQIAAFLAIALMVAVIRGVT